MNFISAHIEQIVLVITLIVTISFSFIIYIGIKNYFALKKQCQDLARVNEELIAEKDKIASSSSLDLLKYLQSVTMQVATIKFKDYVDEHDMTKVTKENIKRLAAEVATDVRDALKIEKLHEVSTNTLLTDEFYMTFIVHIAISSIKELMNREIDKMEV